VSLGGDNNSEDWGKIGDGKDASQKFPSLELSPCREFWA